jgi:flagellar hook-basal body complex protein FliE
MTVAQLRRVRQAATQTDRGPDLPDLESATSGPSFGDTLEKAIDSVDQTQKTADEKIGAFVAGETQNLHEVMISMNQAKVHFELMNEVRNRGLETYRELMRMQI